MFKGAVRLLVSSRDAPDRLFFTTSLKSSVLCYSIEQDRLLDICCDHPSPPTVVALSATSTYMLSASSTPRTILLLDTTSEVGPIPMKPRNSDAQISTAAFHPNNQDTFLLGFMNGTLSVHSCSRIVLGRDKRSEGLLGCYQRLHQQSSKRKNIVSKHSVLGTTSAAFLGGHKARTVSIGADRICKIVDFEKRPQILCSWSLGAFGVALAVLSSGTTAGVRNRDWIAPMHGVKNESPPSGADDDLIAIAKSNGHVTVYSPIGVVQQEVRASRHTRHIVDLDWVRSPELCPSGSAMLKDATLRALPEQQHNATKYQDGLLDLLRSTGSNRFSNFMQGVSLRGRRPLEGEQMASKSSHSNETPNSFFSVPSRQRGTGMNCTGFNCSEETTGTCIVTRSSEKQKEQSSDATTAIDPSNKLRKSTTRTLWQTIRNDPRDRQLLHATHKGQKSFTVHTEHSATIDSPNDSSLPQTADWPEAPVHRPAGQQRDCSTLPTRSRHEHGSSSQTQSRNKPAPSYRNHNFVRPKISLTSFFPPSTAASSGGVRTVQDIITAPLDSAHGSPGSESRSGDDGICIQPIAASAAATCDEW